MKTIALTAALVGLSAVSAYACDYGNTSAKADSKMTVASIETARQTLQDPTRVDTATTSSTDGTKADEKK